MFDSVFSQYVSQHSQNVMPFEGDRPLIAVRSIVGSLDAVALPLADQLYNLLAQAIDRFIGDKFRAVEVKDKFKVLTGEWNLPNQLQLALFQGWKAAWLLGGQDLLAEVKAAFPPSWQQALQYSRYSTPFDRLNADNQQAIKAALQLEPRPLSVGNPAVGAVQARTFQLAGNFASTQLERLKLDLVAAIDNAGDNPISRKELVNRIQDNLKVGKARAEAIAQTETTHAYNLGRVATAMESDVVTHFRFLAISDSRTTPICSSRNGMVFPKNEALYHTPPLHVRCRSTISPVMAELLPKHQEWVDDPERSPDQRDLVPLPKNWRSSSLPEPAVTAVAVSSQPYNWPSDPDLTVDSILASHPRRLGTIGAQKASDLSQLERQVRRWEDTHRLDAVESALVLKPNGEPLLQLKGTEDRVTFLDEHEKLIKGNIVTHNHPPLNDYDRKGVSFSAGDVDFAVSLEAAEMRAVSKGYRHTLKPGTAQWNRQYWDEVAEPVYKKHYEAVWEEMRALKPQLQQAGWNDERIHAQLNQDYWHVVTQRTAQELGWEYTRERWKEV